MASWTWGKTACSPNSCLPLPDKPKSNSHILLQHYRAIPMPLQTAGWLWTYASDATRGYFSQPANQSDRRSNNFQKRQSCLCTTCQPLRLSLSTIPNHFVHDKRISFGVQSYKMQMAMSVGFWNDSKKYFCSSVWKAYFIAPNQWHRSCNHIVYEYLPWF